MEHPQFEPLSCFARFNGQTSHQVFSEMQGRMRTILGFLLSRLPDEEADVLEADPENGKFVAELRHWQSSSLLLTSKEFDSLATRLGANIGDVLGMPNVAEDDAKVIRNQLSDSEFGLDPVKLYVVMAAIERMDEMVIGGREWVRVMIDDADLRPKVSV